MKFSIALVIVLMAGVFTVKAGPEDPKGKDVFVVKTEKKYIGAKVQVFNAAGELLATQTLKTRKMVIDFGDVKLGTYTIRLSKDSKTKEFYFEKKQM